MTIVIELLLGLALVPVLAWLTNLYWQRLNRKAEKAKKPVPKQQTAAQEIVTQNAFMERKIQTEHMERMKDRAASQKKTQDLKTKVDFLGDVLFEVQRQQLNISSYIKVLTTVNLQPGQAEWNMVSNELKERSERLTEMVNDTMELIRYEDLPVIENTDMVPMNAFCKDVLTDCQKQQNGKVDLRLETELEDEEAFYTNVNYLQRVLTKLLTSFIDCTHEGEIVLSVNRHRQNQNDYLKFVLTNTDSNFPEYMMDSTFERMPDSDLSIKMILVRLRLCKMLVKLLGGTMYRDTTNEEGTSIVFTIRTVKE